MNIMGHGGPAGPRGELGEEVFAEFDSGITRRFLGYLRPYRRRAIVALLAVAAFVASQVAIPLALRHGIDAALGHAHVSLAVAASGFIVLVLFNAWIACQQERLAALLAQQVIFDIRRDMFSHLQRVSADFIERTHVGRIMSRIQGDVNSLQEFLENSIQAVGDLFLLTGLIVLLVAMNPRLGLLTLAALPVIVAIRHAWLPRAKRAFRAARDASSICNAALAENINGVRTIQAARREAHNLAAFDAKALANYRAQIRSAWSAQVMVPTIDVVTGVAQAVVVIVGGGEVLSGRISVGVMIAFLFVVQRVFDPIRTISQQYTVMQRAMAAGQRIFELLDVPVLVEDRPGARTLPAGAAASIELDHVTFAYRPGQPVLHDICLHVAAGETVALVGPTGSGKSSIAGLIRRFHDAGSGTVRIAGYDVRDIALDSLGRTIAMVLQEPFLFSGTVLENIRYNADASREQVIAAAKAVAANDFIAALPQGYDTPLGQRGQNLSLGQRQLLSFARALVADPRILILDEATASIDSVTEERIQTALEALMAGRTSIVIAHRLATVRHADRIVVLQHGRIIEEGSHDQLLGEDGLYARLYRHNTGSFDDIAEEAVPA